jgi:hypothetical protein
LACGWISTYSGYGPAEREADASGTGEGVFRKTLNVTIEMELSVVLKRNFWKVGRVDLSAGMFFWKLKKIDSRN